jgi:hypothetical protein
MAVGGGVGMVAAERGLEVLQRSLLHCRGLVEVTQEPIES